MSVPSNYKIKFRSILHCTCDSYLWVARSKWRPFWSDPCGHGEVLLDASFCLWCCYWSILYCWCSIKLPAWFRIVLLIKEPFMICVHTFMFGGNFVHGRFLFGRFVHLRSNSEMSHNGTSSPHNDWPMEIPCISAVYDEKRNSSEFECKYYDFDRLSKQSVTWKHDALICPDDALRNLDTAFRPFSNFAPFEKKLGEYQCWRTRESCPRTAVLKPHATLLNDFPALRYAVRKTIICWNLSVFSKKQWKIWNFLFAGRVETIQRCNFRVNRRGNDFWGQHFAVSWVSVTLRPVGTETDWWCLPSHAPLPCLRHSAAGFPRQWNTILVSTSCQKGPVVLMQIKRIGVQASMTISTIKRNKFVTLR